MQGCGQPDHPEARAFLCRPDAIWLAEPPRGLGSRLRSVGTIQIGNTTRLKPTAAPTRHPTAPQPPRGLAFHHTPAGAVAGRNTPKLRLPGPLGHHPWGADRHEAQAPGCARAAPTRARSPRGLGAERRSGTTPEGRASTRLRRPMALGRRSLGPKHPEAQAPKGGPAPRAWAEPPRSSGFRRSP